MLSLRVALGGYGSPSVMLYSVFCDRFHLSENPSPLEGLPLISHVVNEAEWLPFFGVRSPRLSASPIRDFHLLFQSNEDSCFASFPPPNVPNHVRNISRRVDRLTHPPKQAHRHHVILLLIIRHQHPAICPSQGALGHVIVGLVSVRSHRRRCAVARTMHRHTVSSPPTLRWRIFL